MHQTRSHCKQIYLEGAKVRKKGQKKKGGGNSITLGVGGAGKPRRKSNEEGGGGVVLVCVDYKRKMVRIRIEREREWFAVYNTSSWCFTHASTTFCFIFTIIIMSLVIGEGGVVVLGGDWREREERGEREVDS